MYWLSRQVGAAGETPLIVQEIQQRIAEDRRLQDDLIRVLNHDLAPSKLFTIGLALSAAARTFAGGRGHRRLVLREAANLVSAEVANKSRSRAPASVRRSKQLEIPSACSRLQCQRSGSGATSSVGVPVGTPASRSYLMDIG
jgi:hypothetical protein